MGKIILSCLVLMWLTACNSGSHPSGTHIPASDSTSSGTLQEDTTDEVLEDEYARFFVVITDTGQQYAPLHTKMVALQAQTKIPVDTMGRHYNRAKDLIALPDNDPDEIYAGEYYPRRFPSVNLSLEYLSVYQERSREKTIALVAGIFDSAKSADSLLSVLKKTQKQAFRVKSVLYVGCMH